MFPFTYLDWELRRKQYACKVLHFGTIKFTCICILICEPPKLSYNLFHLQIMCLLFYFSLLIVYLNTFSFGFLYDTLFMLICSSSIWPRHHNCFSRLWCSTWWSSWLLRCKDKSSIILFYMIISCYMSIISESLWHLESMIVNYWAPIENLQ